MSIRLLSQAVILRRFRFGLPEHALVHNGVPVTFNGEQIVVSPSTY
jgi:hypothetical protein